MSSVRSSCLQLQTNQSTTGYLAIVTKLPVQDTDLNLQLSGLALPLR
jgi:hypothetical protein